MKTLAYGFLILCIIAIVNADVKIAGGTKAVDGQFPYQVYLNFGDSICGGGLITPRHVLTAAHCFSSNTTQLRVVFGVADVADPPASNFAYASHYVMHNYTGFDSGNDIAIVQLYSDVTLSANVALMSIGVGDIVLGNSVTLSGWGKIKNGTDQTELLYTTLKVVSPQACGEVYSTFKNQTQVCVSGGNPDACPGDSGGSIVTKADGTFVSIALVAYGEAECGVGSTPGVYTRSGVYVDWMNAQINNLYNYTNPNRTNPTDPALPMMRVPQVDPNNYVHKEGARNVTTAAIPFIVNTATPTPTSAPTTTSTTSPTTTPTTTSTTSPTVTTTTLAPSFANIKSEYSLVLLFVCLILML